MTVLALQPTEDALLAQHAAEDARAFLALYERYFPRVYTYFRYRCPDPATCDDLAAQTFEQALTHIARYAPERGPFAAWLFGIARNLANNRAKRARRWTWLPLDAVYGLEGHDPIPEEATIQAEEQARMLAHIRQLAPRQQDLLALKFSGGLTNREIAALTGLSESNVGVILHRTLRTLRTWLREAEDDHA